MGRPFLEFLHAQDLPWQPSQIFQGAVDKQLSADPDGDARTLLVRFPKGWSTQWASTSAAEIFVLSGNLQIGKSNAGLHHYAYLPVSTSSVSIVAIDEVTILLFLDPPASGEDPAYFIDTLALDWDRSGLESEIAHLNYARKNLRLAPDGNRRTYLLGGMPHGVPANGARLERHPHGEEMFMIAGDMPCSLGVMTAGAYFHRPPNVWHGLDCTIGGFLLLMRTPGSNVTISEWSDDILPVSIELPYTPELPVGHPSLDADPRRPMADY